MMAIPAQLWATRSAYRAVSTHLGRVLAFKGIAYISPHAHRLSKKPALPNGSRKNEEVFCLQSLFLFMRPSAYVYILTNKTKTVLYVGVTNDLPTRLWEHREKQSPTSFTARYNLSILVYYEGYTWIGHAIQREKYIKGKTRKWKEALIHSKNPVWRDLTDDLMR